MNLKLNRLCDDLIFPYGHFETVFACEKRVLWDCEKTDREAIIKSAVGC